MQAVARAGDGGLLVAIAAGQVKGIGAFGRCRRLIQQNRQRTDGAGELRRGVERSGQVVGYQAQGRHATALRALAFERTTCTSRPRSRMRAISPGSARSSVISSWTAVSSQILQNAAAPNLDASARRTILRAAEIIARFIAAASSEVSVKARPLIACVPMNATSTLRLPRKLSPGSPRTVRDSGRTVPPRQRTRILFEADKAWPIPRSLVTAVSAMSRSTEARAAARTVELLSKMTLAPECSVAAAASPIDSFSGRSNSAVIAASGSKVD